MWDDTAMAYESQVSGYPRQVDCLSNNSWFVHWHYLMWSSVATAVLTSWAKPRTHVPQHSSAVAQGTGLATIMLDLDMLVQVHFPCTKHSHATYSFFEGWTPFAFEPLKNQTKPYNLIKPLVDVVNWFAMSFPSDTRSSRSASFMGSAAIHHAGQLPLPGLQLGRHRSSTWAPRPSGCGTTRLDEWQFPIEDEEA